jgi:hypothetical protein
MVRVMMSWMWCLWAYPFTGEGDCVGGRVGGWAGVYRKEYYGSQASISRLTGRRWETYKPSRWVCMKT